MHFEPSTANTLARNKSSEWIASQLQELGDITAPADRGRRLVITGLTRFGFWAKAKVYQQHYFPAFTRRMAEHGIDCHFVWTEEQLEALVTGSGTAILHLHNEEKPWPYGERVRAAERLADTVFCTRRAASIMADKRRTNMFMSSHGVPMPRMLANSEDSAVFSNAVTGSGKRVRVMAAGAPVDAERYNTAFIDTRVEYGGRSYYTMFRIQAVGRKVLHAYVRARDTREGSASVHSKDTPQDAGLINMLHERLVESRRDRIAEFTRQAGELLGPGSYAHDMVVCSESGDLFMVETGFKFNDQPYADYLAGIAGQIPCNRIFYDGSFPAVAADLFVGEWDHALHSPPPDPSVELRV